MIQSSSTTSSTGFDVPMSERMGGMRKLTKKPVLPSSVSCPQRQGVEGPTDPTSNEYSSFGGLLLLSEICNEPTIEEASNILTISGSSRSAHIQDRTQGIITAYDVPPEDIPIPSTNLDEIRTQLSTHLSPKRRSAFPRCHKSGSEFKIEFVQSG
ncbi:hypothetical protein Nepgr_018834 [Nepenthes gracilis]|uniref:Uncharacterized protein n=1 Tax=Nepenthes gracilis TaxID=150966 RepID=A0AAD3XTU4_NEPGR|nr:hypothetical protein Nepgr_018834 [Nepenthes gracilis]